MNPAASVSASSRAAQLEAALKTIIRGKDDVVRLAIVTVLARGHQSHYAKDPVSPAGIDE